jgi:cobyrinic acid a,c-diamide synthase
VSAPATTPDESPLQLGPRVVVAGTHSGVGKTTVATGLMAALRRRGRRVGSAKVGPDFIDPGYHHIATGSVGRNLDTFLCGPDAVPGIAGRAAAGNDLLIVEGVMGLFDGLGSSSAASSAEVAVLLGAPVVLVVDGSSMSSSVRALVDGYDRHLVERFGPRLAGVILNRVGSDTHESLLREALEGAAPVMGALRRDDALSWRDRHLGLVPVVERPDEIAASLDRLAAVVGAGIDLDAIERLARTAPARRVDPPPAATAVVSTPVPIAVMSGPAFSFSYPDNLEQLARAGAALVPVDPRTDPALPSGVRGLYACGGFPEVFAEELAANRPLLDDVRARVEAGLAVWAECGGMLWLSRSLDGHQLAGALPVDARLGTRVTVGYRSATVLTDCPIGARGTSLRGHEHHYSWAEPPGEALELAGRSGTTRQGWATRRLLASYLHLHLGGDPAPARRFVATAAGE